MSFKFDTLTWEKMQTILAWHNADTGATVIPGSLSAQAISGTTGTFSGAITNGTFVATAGALSGITSITNSGLTYSTTGFVLGTAANRPYFRSLSTNDCWINAPLGDVKIYGTNTLAATFSGANTTFPGDVTVGEDVTLKGKVIHDKVGLSRVLYDITKQVTLTDATIITVFDPSTETDSAAWIGKIIINVANFNTRYQEVFARSISSWQNKPLTSLGTEFVFDESGSQPGSWVASKYNFYWDGSILKCYNNTGTTKVGVFKFIELTAP